MFLEVLYGQKLLMPSTNGQYPSTGENGQSQTGYKDLWQRRGESRAYFVIVCGAEECSTWIAFRIHNYVFYSEEEKARLCEIIKSE